MQLSRLCPQLTRALRWHARPAVPPAVPMAAAAAAIMAALASLSGCGSAAPSAGQGAASPHASSPMASPPVVSPTSGSRPAAAVAQCSAPALRIRLDGSAAGAAAGNYYVPLEFTNTTVKSCTLPEYPAVAFTSDATGPPIGGAAALAPGAHARTTVLAPRAVAHSWLQIADVANYPASTCKPVQAKGLLVSFAGSAQAAFLGHPFLVCAKAMRGTDILYVFPVQTGRAKRGTAP
jgi:hypothetical protein